MSTVIICILSAALGVMAFMFINLRDKFLDSAKNNDRLLVLVKDLQESNNKLSRICDDSIRIAKEINADLIVANRRASMFSKEDIDVLIRLCHPDRHEQRASSVVMTRHLLSIREGFKTNA